MVRINFVITHVCSVLSADGDSPAKFQQLCCVTWERFVEARGGGGGVAPGSRFLPWMVAYGNQNGIVLVEMCVVCFYFCG